MAIVTTTVGGEWTLKTGDFVNLVLRKLGALSAGESASPEDYADAKQLIDSSLKSMHADGLMWWAVKTDNVSFSSSFASRPSDCVACVHASWNGYPVDRVDRITYERIQDKQESGRPSVVFDDGVNLNIWPVGTGDLRLTYLREVISTSQNAEMDVPKEILRPLIDYMAWQIEPWFDVPAQKAQRIVADGMASRITLLALSNVGVDHQPTQAEYF